jgi:small subunit ribosomal protein S19e
MEAERVKVLDVDARTFINMLAERLKEKIKMPRWALYVKTSPGAERPPDKSDWWYTRAASILRKIYLKGIIGVERLRKQYKRKKKHKVYPARPYKASGKVIREILKQLEEAKLVQKVEKPRKGRSLTKEGVKMLESLAREIKEGKVKIKG